MSHDWKGVIDAKDVARLYNEKMGHWLLLEVLEKDANGKAKKFKLVAWDKDKDKLYELMDDDDWDWDKQYIFVFADPNSLCEL